MARVELRVDDLERGDVPAVSVKTGRPCANPVGLRLRHRRVVLPLEPGRARLHRVLLLAAWPTLVVVIVALFIAPDIAAIAVALYAVLVLVGELLWVGARAGSSTETMVLTRVHQAFVDAVSR
jgi:hypothetical protein